MKLIKRKNLRGQGLVEYALLLLLLGSAAILGLSVSGVSLSQLYTDLKNGFDFGSENPSSSSCAALAQAGDDWQVLKDGFWKGGITGAYDVCPLCGGLLPGYSGSDYSIDLSGVGVTNTRPTWNGYGVAFRSSYDKSGLDGYMFEVEQVNKNQPVKIYFSKWVNGKQIQPSLSVTELPSNFDWTNPPDFQIQAKGDSFTAYLDGKQMLTAKDSTYLNGGVGVISNQGTELTFEDLTVNQANCEEAAP